jgi:HEPN domain-containing protein/predicted nucleotidyltransferase
MNLSLPERSKSHEDRIKEINEIIIRIAKDKVAFVILFGSFARGSWIRYRYNECGVVYDYASDYNFLIITKNVRQIGKCNPFDLERKIIKEIHNSTFTKQIHKIHIIIESIDRVNDKLEKSQSFFSDIKKEGIILYDSGEFKLSNPKNYDIEQKLKITKLNYEHWFQCAEGFLIDYKNAFERNDYKKASFYLHQTTEHLYNCVLFTLGGYKPKSHDLEELNRLCVLYSNDFLAIFPKATKEQKECFELLQQCYIDARYSKHFSIKKEQLEYLVARVEKLKELVSKIFSLTT